MVHVYSVPLSGSLHQFLLIFSISNSPDQSTLIIFREKISNNPTYFSGEKIYNQEIFADLVYSFNKLYVELYSPKWTGYIKK